MVWEQKNRVIVQLCNLEEEDDEVHVQSSSDSMLCYHNIHCYSSQRKAAIDIGLIMRERASMEN